MVPSNSSRLSSSVKSIPKLLLKRIGIDSTIGIPSDVCVTSPL